jgi:hypothetical protein
MNLVRFTAAAATVCALLGPGALLAQTRNTNVDFSNGTQGWEGIWHGDDSVIDTTLGRDAPSYRTRFETFALTYINSANAAFLGDFTTSKSVTFGLDVNVLQLYHAEPDGPVNTQRDLVLELRDYDRQVGGMPYSAVWVTLGTLQAGMGWQHLSATIADTASGVMPDGWGGYGKPTPDGSPELPDGVSFSDILRGVDEIALTTFVPGFAYRMGVFDVAIDNVSVVSSVPEPATVVLQASGLMLLAGMARRRRMRKDGR